MHRTLSRYLHIQKHATNKLGELGATLEQFDERLFRAATHFATFLDDVKQNEGFGTMDGTFLRFINSPYLKKTEMYSKRNMYDVVFWIHKL